MTAARAITRRRFAAHTLAALATSALLAGCDRGKTPTQPVPAGSTVLALGDSLTAGTGAAPDQSYPAVLARLSGWNVINAGVSGDTAAQALARLPALLAQHQPRLVIISIGANDFLRQLPEADTRAHIHTMARLAREAGAQVLLVALPRATAAAALGQMTDHTLYAEVARDLKLPLQREGWGEVLARAELRSDLIHPNAQGYTAFARSLAATATAAGLLQRP